jgi:hypothetical protein
MRAWPALAAACLHALRLRARAGEAHASSTRTSLPLSQHDQRKQTVLLLCNSSSSCRPCKPCLVPRAPTKSPSTGLHDATPAPARASPLLVLPRALWQPATAPTQATGPCAHLAQPPSPASPAPRAPLVSTA